MTVYWLSAVLAAFMQGVNGWLFWPLFPVLWAASRVEDASRVYFLSLITGLLVDLLVGRKLGLSAGFILVASGLVYFYRSRGRISLLLLLLYAVASSFIVRMLWG